MRGSINTGLALALALLGGCGRPQASTGQIADTGRPTTSDRDPYLAVNTMLVANACSNCHAADYTRVGPAMTDIAIAFPNPTADDLTRLRTSILEGATGKWGSAIMPAQHQVKPEQIDAIVRTILSAKAP